MVLRRELRPRGTALLGKYYEYESNVTNAEPFVGNPYVVIAHFCHTLNEDLRSYESHLRIYRVPLFQGIMRISNLVALGAGADESAATFCCAHCKDACLPFAYKYSRSSTAPLTSSHVSCSLFNGSSTQAAATEQQQSSISGGVLMFPVHIHCSRPDPVSLPRRQSLSLRHSAPLFRRLFTAVPHIPLPAAVALPGADGFVSPAGFLLSSPSQASHHSATRSHTMSYQDKLREAQAARGGQKGSPIPPPASVPGSGRTKPADLPAVAESPFSPEMQEELRTAITILSARLQREKPMTRAEFERFESAVAIIVEDASPTQELPTQAAPPAAAAPAVVSAPAPAPPAGGLKAIDELESEGPAWDAKAAVQYGLPSGVQNSYVIDDMGKMNPEEYQEALR